jgi:hypothetical protein
LPSPRTAGWRRRMMTARTGMDTPDRELFLCPGTATPTAAPAVWTGTEPDGSTGSLDGRGTRRQRRQRPGDIITAARSVPSKEAVRHRGEAGQSRPASRS